VPRKPFYLLNEKVKRNIKEVKQMEKHTFFRNYIMDEHRIDLEINDEKIPNDNF